MSKSTSSVCRSKNPASCRFHGVSFYPQHDYHELKAVITELDKQIAMLANDNPETAYIPWDGPTAVMREYLTGKMISAADDSDTTPEGLAALKQRKEELLTANRFSLANTYNRRIAVTEAYLAYRDESIERIRQAQTVLEGLYSGVNMEKDEFLRLSVQQELDQLTSLARQEKSPTYRSARRRLRHEFEKYVKTSGFSKS
jgi:hypothetical protein